jgi:nicotinamide mononucleotide transporter
VTVIEIIAAAITLWSIWLATKEHIWYWPTGIVSLILYTWTFYRAKLYGETLLQIICLVLMVYGWYVWLHGGKNSTELPVRKTPQSAWFPLMTIGVVGSAATAFLMRRYTDNPSPYIDAAILVFSLVAQLMTARKWLESWPMWVVINIVSVHLYIVRGLYPTAVLYVALLILAIKGYRDWKRSLASS